LTKDYIDFGGILGKSIKERLSKAIIEIIVSAGVAMGKMNKIVSDANDTLFSIIFMIKIHVEFGLTY
jgi:hypothetical protein